MDPSSQTDLLFVYGTLRREGRSHRLLRQLGARWRGRGTVAGELFDFGAYPGALPQASPSSRIAGELYEFPSPDRAFERLDSYEGSKFLRQVTAVTLEDGSEVQAWIYWLVRLSGPWRRIASGDYLQHLGRKEG